MPPAFSRRRRFTSPESKRVSKKSEDRSRKTEGPAGTIQPAFFVYRRAARGVVAGRPAFPFGGSLRAKRAAVQVIVDQAHRLHERVHRRRSDEAPAALLEILRQRDATRASSASSSAVPGELPGPRPRSGSKRQTKSASEPNSSISSAQRFALLIVLSILPRWRTMPASFSRRVTSRCAEARHALDVESRERAAEVLALAQDRQPARARSGIPRGRSSRTAADRRGPGSPTRYRDRRRSRRRPAPCAADAAVLALP